MARTLTHDIVGFRVLLARHSGVASTPGDYGDFEDCNVTLLPGTIQEFMAPKFGQAKCTLALAALSTWPWNWKRFVGFDDRIRVTDMDPDAPRVYFEGFVTDVDWGFGSRDASVVVTANSPAYRLLRDDVVEGRWMVRTDGELDHFSGLPCVFNAGGLPNLAPVLAEDTRETPYESVREGLPVFTADNAFGALYWTVGDMLDYLAAFYNHPATWISNIAFDPDMIDNSPRASVTCQGLSIWAAMAAAAEQGGFDLFEEIKSQPFSDEEAPIYRIVLRSRFPSDTEAWRILGEEKTVKHQASPDGPGDGSANLQWLDLDQTNLFSLALAESNASSVTRPLVLGAQDICEITVDLGKAWYPADNPAKADILPTSSDPDKEGNYYKRYVNDGTEFASYADVGRLWDANTDGRYTAAPYSLDAADVANLTDDEDPESWPPMAHAPLPMVTNLRGTGSDGSADSFAEYSLDEGDTWQPLVGYKVLPDRLGIRIDQPNLADILPADGDEETGNFFYALADVPANVQVRLTCSIASPHRRTAWPAARAGAGSIFGQTQLFDRGSAYQLRHVCWSSTFYEEAGYLSDESSEGDHTAVPAAADADAERLQDCLEDRFLEGSVPIEWPEEPIYLGDRLTSIEGLGVDLGANAGLARRYPRVVARTLLLTPQTHQLVLTLDTYRKAGAV